MASVFSPKQYFKKIHNHEIVSKLYKDNGIDAFFEITENTPRKNSSAILTDFYLALGETDKLTLSPIFSLVAKISHENTVDLLYALHAKRDGKVPEPLLECHTPYDTVLYYYTHEKTLFDEVLFFTSFYEKPSYMIYESKKVDLVEGNLALTELSREFTRIATKENETLVVNVEGKSLGQALYVRMKTYKDDHDSEHDINVLSMLRVIYLDQTQEVLIAYTGPKYEKQVFLDTFLRIVCNSSFDDKEELYTFTQFKKKDFDFGVHTRGVPYINWKIQSITLSYGSENIRKKIKLTIPTQGEARGMSALTEMTEELGMETISTYEIDSVSFAFFLPHSKKPNTSTKLPVTLSKHKSNLCPLFSSHRDARTILKNASIYEGFIEKAKKEKEEIGKKWEV